MSRRPSTPRGYATAGSWSLRETAETDRSSSTRTSISCARSSIVVRKSDIELLRVVTGRAVFGASAPDGATRPFTGQAIALAELDPGSHLLLFDLA